MVKEELLIIDGTALLFKMYFAKFNQLSREGVEVGGVIGVSRALVKLISQHNCRYVVVVFDAGAKTFRNEMLPSYKGNRPPPPDDLIPQFDLVYEAAQYLGCQTYKKVGFEADDIIATLVHQATDANLPVTMVTDDKDVMALISEDSPKCHQWLYTKKELMDSSSVHKKFGVNPSQMVDYLSLLGDTSDNVPGVKGVGAKSAMSLLQHFGTLESIYASIDDVSGLPIRGAASIQKKLETDRETALLAKRLITLRTDVPIGSVFWSDLEFKGAREDAYPFFYDLGATYFLNWLQEYMEN